MAHAPITLTRPSERKLPILPINTPFLLGYHAGSWECRLGRTPEQDRIVPLLITYAIAPGIHAVLESSRGNYAEMLDAVTPLLRRTGTVPLPWTGGPDAIWNATESGPGGYLHVDDVSEPETQRHGQHYYAAWDELIPGSHATAHRADRFDAFVAYWVERGLIDALPPRATVLAKLSEIRERTARVVEVGAGKPPTERQARLKRELALWTAMEERTATVDDPASVTLAPTSTPARRKTKASDPAGTPAADGFDDA